MNVHATRTTPIIPTWERAPSSARDWIRPSWMYSSMVGAMLGMTLSAAVATFVLPVLAAYRAGAPRLISVEIIALTAGLEGAIIGYFQWRTLRRLFPTLSSGAWVAVSMISAGAGCLLSWLPTSFALTGALAPHLGDLNLRAIDIAKFSIVTGSLVGLVWGVGQYFVLRLHVHRAGKWIGASMLAWAMSFAWIFLAAMAPDRSTDPLTRILFGTFSGFVLGAALGTVQGHVLSGLDSRLLTTRNETTVTG